MNKFRININCTSCAREMLASAHLTDTVFFNLVRVNFVKYN